MDQFNQIVDIFIILLGICLILYGLLMSLIGYWSKKWPLAKGVIKSADYKESHEKLKRKMKYLYTIGNREYYSSRITFAPLDFFQKREAISFVKNAKEMDTIEVRYNPYVKSMSVIIPGVSKYPTHLVVAGLFFIFSYFWWQ